MTGIILTAATVVTSFQSSPEKKPENLHFKQFKKRCTKTLICDLDVNARHGAPYSVQNCAADTMATMRIFK